MTDKKEFEIAYQIFKSSSLLGSTVPKLKLLYEDTDEYENMAKKVAKICADITIEILNPLFAKYPNLEKEMENIISENSE